MKFINLLQILILSGCFYIGQERYEDVIQKPSSEWSSRDCLTILLSVMKNNFYDQDSPNIKVMATPYYPVVITTLNRISQRKKHWSEFEYRKDVDIAMLELAGLYIDWDINKLVDSRGNYYRRPEQLDSLLFLVTLHNRSWPCNVPIFTYTSGGGVVSIPLTKWFSDWPCYVPDITDLEDKIYLLNDKNKYIKPKYVWGKKQSYLAMEETLLIMFQLRENDHHFFAETENVYLAIKGFEKDIRLAFPLSEIY